MTSADLRVTMLMSCAMAARSRIPTSLPGAPALAALRSSRLACSAESPSV